MVRPAHSRRACSSVGTWAGSWSPGRSLIFPTPSMIGSWWTAKVPSAARRTSSSTPSAPAARDRAKASSVFPRWPSTRGRRDGAIRRRRYLRRVGLRPGRMIALVAVASLAACGSTVPAAQRRVASAAGSVEGSLGGGPSGGSAGSDASGAPVGASDVTNGSARAATSASASKSKAGGSAPRGAVGVVGSHAPIEVGIGVDRNDAAFAAAFGVTTSQPEEKTVAEAVVADINKHGGLAGHPIAPVYTEFDNTSSDWIAQDQASCATFTEDHHVVAVVRSDDIFGPLDTCVA